LFLVGGIGGISPRLLSFSVNPVGFVNEFKSILDFIPWLLGVIILFFLSGFIAWVFEKNSARIYLPKAFYLGIATPSIIFTAAYQTNYSYVLYKSVDSKDNRDKYIQGSFIPLDILLASSNTSKDKQIYEQPFKEKVELVPATRQTTFKSFDMAPNKIFFYFALTEQSLGEFDLSVRLNLQAQDSITLTKQKNISIYQRKEGKTYYDNYGYFSLDNVKPKNYKYSFEISTQDIIFKDLGELPLQEGDWINFVCILDMKTNRLYIHKAKNLNDHEYLKWTSDLREKYSEEANFIKRLLEGLIGIFNIHW